MQRLRTSTKWVSFARAEGIFFGSAMGRGSDRTAMAVVAEINDEAHRYLKMIVNGRPLSAAQ